MNSHTRTHRLIGDYVGSAWFYCVWVVVKKLWISAASNITDAGLNAGISLLNAVADLALLTYLWPFSARMANVEHLILRRWEPRGVLDLYGAVKHFFSFPNLVGKQHKRRYEQLCWKTYYNILITKRKGRLYGEVTDTPASVDD